MEVVAPIASSSLLVVSNSRNSRTLRTHHHRLSAHLKRSLNSSSQVIWSPHIVSRMGLALIGSHLQRSVSSITGKMRCCKPIKHSDQVLVCSPLFQPLRKLRSISFRRFSLLPCNGSQNFVGFGVDIYKLKYWLEKLRQGVNVVFIHVVVGMMIIMSVSLTVSRSTSWALTEENLLFLEAWRTVDRAYVDKTFNGQSWFRYREDALRNEPMNTREETCTVLNFLSKCSSFHM